MRSTACGRTAQTVHSTTAMKNKQFLGGGFIFFIFSPLFGQDVQFDEYFFRWVETTNYSMFYLFFQYLHSFEIRLSVRVFVTCFFLVTKVVGKSKRLKFRNFRLFWPGGICFTCTPKKLTLSETNSKSSEDGWLEDSFSFWDGIFFR